ncbi:chorismate synthase [Candidatus Nitrospira allomarina]|uniref:Chorismate synthase n=1 Tax=Candidatus Nitrospira allomarina TaxID=3020900 RepID=A0AA96JTH4_9BACT|nr:chorismate synthase [Candidatus Nitrospira allomarina]WNM59533.1 chorismate synthase [Candidatus Nitrospira allomarina]
MLRYLNAGESHGRGLMAVVEGVPSGLPVTAEGINVDLIRRQGGYGRGGRMRIEKDRIEFICGVRKGKTLGNPLGLLIWNKDWENWKDIMASEPGPPSTERVVTRPRPGHADLVGAIKYGHSDIRNVLEKASARETAIRVAIGGVAKSLLAEFGMRVVSYTMDIGGVAAPRPNDPLLAYEHAEQSEVRCHDPETAKKMVEQIRAAKHKGDSLGGIFEVVVTNVPIGLGTYAQWDRRLSARLAFAAMSIQAMKGVEIGMGFESARRFGSEVHDDIYFDKARGQFTRKSNNAGGLEGGITNGQPIVLRVAMKPIATLYTPKDSVDIETKEPFEATVERSDICTVPAAGVVGEAVIAYEMANALIEKFGGDTLDEMKRNFEAYQEYVRTF